MHWKHHLHGDLGAKRRLGTGFWHGYRVPRSLGIHQRPRQLGRQPTGVVIEFAGCSREPRQTSSAPRTPCFHGCRQELRRLIA